MAAEKSSKLMQARDANGMPVSAQQIGMVPEPFVRPLRCPFCEHQVQPQGAAAHISTKGKPFTISAHFRLAKHKDGSPAAHEPGCDLLTTHTISTIARASEGFAELKRGRLELRLVLPKTTDPAAPLAPAPGAPIDAPPADPVNHKIRSVGPPQPPAVTTCARIAQLLTFFGDDPETLEQFTVRHPGLPTPVPWTDFCFGPEPQSIGRLYRALASTTLRAPVLVHGKVISSRVSPASGYAWCVIARDTPTGGTGLASRAPVILRSRHPQLLAPLERGMHVLGLGAPDEPWALQETGSDPAPPLRLFVNAHWQLSYWTVGPDGRPGTPASPAPLPPPTAPLTGTSTRKGTRLASSEALRQWTQRTSAAPDTRASSAAADTASDRDQQAEPQAQQAYAEQGQDVAEARSEPTEPWWEAVGRGLGLAVPPMPSSPPPLPPAGDGDSQETGTAD